MPDNPIPDERCYCDDCHDQPEPAGNFDRGEVAGGDRPYLIERITKQRDEINLLHAALSRKERPAKELRDENARLKSGLEQSKFNGKRAEAALEDARKRVEAEKVSYDVAVAIEFEGNPDTKKYLRAYHDGLMDALAAIGGQDTEEKTKEVDEDE